MWGAGGRVRARLRLGPASGKLWTDGQRNARYATIEVSAVSKVEAAECWARVDVFSLAGPQTSRIELGTAVIPTFPIHPLERKG